MIKYSADSRIQEPTVLCSVAALVRSGLSPYSANFPEMYTSIKELHKAETEIGMYVFNENIDYDHYVRRDESNPNVVIPIKERAIVECIRDDITDEGCLILAIQRYLEYFKNMDLLYEVADFFKVPRETIDYWIKEAEEEDWDGN